MTIATPPSPKPESLFKGWSVRTLLITILVLALILSGLFLWRMSRSGPAQNWQPQATPVAAAVVVPRDVPMSLDAMGTLTAVQQVTLAPEVAGRVTTIEFEAGSQVPAGALLVQLFDAPEHANLEAAKAKVAFADLQLRRSEQLAPTGATTIEMLQQRRSERAQAVAAVDLIEAQLVQRQVRAPFSGEIGIRRINLGQYLNAGDTIATLAALDHLYVEFALPQQHIGQLKPGASVDVMSDAFPGRQFTAHVNAIEPKVDESTRNVTVQALLPNADHVLRPGMFVAASLVLPPQQGALVVPATAIQTSAQGDGIIVIRGTDASAGGKAEMVPVQPGRRIGNDVLIISGLSPGDVIITEGQLRVQPGSEVKVTRLDQAGGG
jgi:multidrug efflux system membrane fusion protein